MDLATLIALIENLISSGATHQDYKRVCELAETYRIFITGLDIEKKLIQIVKRESKESFDQRVRLTKSITPAIAGGLRKPFNVVSRNDRIRKGIRMNNERRKLAVEQMINTFFGSPLAKSKGLNYWLKTELARLNCIDPNTWIVTQWNAPASPSDIVTPKPFNVPAANAVHFSVINDEVKWLLVKEKIQVKQTNTVVAANVTQNLANSIIVIPPTPGVNTTQTVEGDRYSLYSENMAIVYEHIADDVVADEAAGQYVKEIKGRRFLAKIFQHKIGFVPADRVGYFKDEATDGRTFVNPWHDALCYFEDSLKTVSEKNITTTLHAFPQKLQYVSACQGKPKTADDVAIKCNGGYTPTGGFCTQCKGSGVKVHTTGMDAIYMKMPSDGKDMIKLDDILVYKSPPVDLVKLQLEIVDRIEPDAHRSTFGTTVLLQKIYNADSGNQKPGSQTATENDNNWETLYNALDPFTEKYSNFWRQQVTIFCMLSGEQYGNFEVFHDFPSDYKLKTRSALIAERGNASKSGVPTFILESYDDDLASLTFTDDPMGMQKYTVKKRYWPFGGKTTEEIAALISGDLIATSDKVLYAYFEPIFQELEFDHPEFYTMVDKLAQWNLVDAMIKTFQDRIAAEVPKQLPLGGNRNIIEETSDLEDKAAAA